MTVTESPDAPSDSVPDLRVEITPRPSEDERDALVVALAVVLSIPTGERVISPVEEPPSRWARAGREAAFANRDLRKRHSRRL